MFWDSRDVSSFRVVLRACLVLLFGLGLSVGADIAAAEPEDTTEVDRLYLEGVTLYKAGRYKSAIERFRQAHTLYPDPKLLYNIGRCHESRGDLDRALDVYRDCMTEPSATAQLIAKARRRIRLVEQVQRRSQKALSTPQPLSAPPKIRVGPGPASGGPQSAAGRPDGGREGLEQREGGALAVTKWISGALGVGLVAGGITVLMLGVADQNKVDEAINDTEPGGTAQMARVEALGLQEDANRKKAIGYALAGVGAAAVIGSAVLFYLDGRDSSERERKAASDLRLRFAYQPGGGAALGVGGTF